MQVRDGDTARQQTRLRFGVMCSGERVPAAFRASLEELLATDGVELALVVLEPGPARGPGQRRTLWDAYLRRHPPDALGSRRLVDLPDELAAAPHVAAGDIAGIRSHRPDVLLCFERGEVPDELLASATYGVWAFAGSDEPHARRRPAAFSEIARGEPAIGRTLVRLTSRADAGVVLHRCFAATRRASYGATLDAVTWAATWMPARAARDILNDCAAYLDAPPAEVAAADPPAPPARDVVRFIARMALARVRVQLRDVFLLERWHVGIVRQPIERFLDEDFEPDVEWLPRRRRGGFLADPFLLPDGTGTRLLVEDWDDRSRRGTIAEMRLDDGAAPLRTAMDVGSHMSYPFVIEHDERVYCIPETHERRAVVLYELDGDGGWTERSTLLDGVAALDATVVRHDGRWWLFCTDGDVDPVGRLMLYWADDLHGPWQPHPGNPIGADVRSCRPAGTPFVVDGTLYRPAQDCAGGYGHAVAINRVTRLTPTEFAEAPAARVAPPRRGAYRAGLHTLAGRNGLTAVDGKRYEPAPRLVAPRVASRVRGLARRLR